MHFFNIFTIFMMALLTTASPQIKPTKLLRDASPQIKPTKVLRDESTTIPTSDIEPITPLAPKHISTPQCAKEPHCVLVTYNTMKQIELDNTSCTNLRDGIVYGVLVANCTCYIFNGSDCTGYIDTFKDCPGLKGPDFKNGKAVRSIRCEGQ